jgi:hypothetical protein
MVAILFPTKTKITMKNHVGAPHFLIVQTGGIATKVG